MFRLHCATASVKKETDPVCNCLNTNKINGIFSKINANSAFMNISMRKYLKNFLSFAFIEKLVLMSVDSKKADQNYMLKYL